MNLARLVADGAARQGARPAVAHGEKTILTYAELAKRVASLAGALRGRLGLEDGDRVAIFMENAPEYVEILLAAWHAGLVAVPINAKLHPKERDWILENSGARVCFTGEDKNDYARLVQHDTIPMREAADDDLAWLFYTSGTTGRPKGAMLTHGNLRAMIEAYFADVDAIAPGDCIIHAAPMSHGSGLYILPHLARCACHVVPESGGFEPDEIFALLQTYAGVTCFFAPTMVMRLVRAPGAREAALANLKTIVYGGGPMYAEDSVAALGLLGPRLVQIYGQGESPMTITCLKREAHQDAARLGTVGKAFTGVEVAVAAPGEIGEVKVRGQVVMKGYWQNRAATDETLRGGWLHTGDLGVLDNDGYLTLKDRSKDVIISGGANIYPREVEEILLRHRAVAEAAVIGRRHPDWGEEVVAFVVPRDGAAVTAAELDALCLENIARFKRPRDYRFVESLPKNNYGKVLKTELRGRTS